MTSLDSLGSITVKEMETATMNAATSVSTTEVRSASHLNIRAVNDVTVSSSTGKIVLDGSSIDMNAAVVLDGVLSDATTDSIKVTGKHVTLNVRPDATDNNASGSGILVCGDSYAQHVASRGVAGNPAAISATWTNDDGGLWTMSGGNLAFTKMLSNGDECVFTFAVLDSGDLVLSRRIGLQVTQSLSHWQNI